MMNLNNADLLKMSSFINGEWLSHRCLSDKDSYFDVINPADQSVIASVLNASTQEAECAVNAAQAALYDWRKTPVKARSNFLMAWYDLILKNIDDLALLLTSEQGKPFAEAKGEILYGASYIQWFAEQAKRINGEIIPSPNQSTQILTTREAIGVVATITPWNFPNAMLARKVAPALAAGCTVVAKPSGETPLSALALGVLAQQAGIPAGVFNIVVGEDAKTIGNVFTTHPDVKKISFTGSTGVGKKLLAQAASSVKAASMELGGNAPFIVFDDADLDAALKGLMQCKFRNAGQACISVNRLFLQRDIATEFIDRLIQNMEKIHIGDALQSSDDETVHIGPLINSEAVSKLHNLVESALNSGASMLYQRVLGMNIGSYYPPTVLANVNPEMDISCTEQFGPVVALSIFDDESQVVELSNNTPYGLAAYAYTRDYQRVWRLKDKLQFGMIGINESAISNEMAPFGGVKESGFGREGSVHGLDDYLVTKYTCLGGL